MECDTFKPENVIVKIEEVPQCTIFTIIVRHPENAPTLSGVLDPVIPPETLITCFRDHSDEFTNVTGLSILELKSNARIEDEGYDVKELAVIIIPIAAVLSVVVLVAGISIIVIVR